MQIKLMLLLLLLTTGLVTNFSGCITKDSFPSIPPYFLLTAIILSRYYKFPHYMRLRQFTSFNPLLIPWNQITLPSHLPLLQFPYPFCQLVNRLSVLVKGEKKPRDFFRPHFPQSESLFTGYPFVACYAGQTNCRFPCSSVSKRGCSLVSK